MFAKEVSDPTTSKVLSKHLPPIKVNFRYLYREQYSLITYFDIMEIIK